MIAPKMTKTARTLTVTGAAKRLFVAVLLALGAHTGERLTQLCPRRFAALVRGRHGARSEKH